MNKTLFFYLLIAAVTVSCSKEKDAELPEISFKSGGNYTDGNASVGQNAVVNVGVVADKNKKDLRRFVVNYSFDAGTYNQYESYLLKSGEKQHFERDVKITTRNEIGTERWQFEISDVDGNTARKEIVLTVN